MHAIHISECMKLILDSDWFKSQQFKTVHWWNDTGSHFRCEKMAHFMMKTLPDQYKFNQVEWNFFVEHHGKSCVDVLFNALTRWYKERLTGNPINSSLELVEFFQKKAEISKHPTIFMTYEPPENRSTHIPIFTIDHIKSFYNYVVKANLYYKAVYQGDNLTPLKYSLGTINALPRKYALPIPTYRHIEKQNINTMERQI